MGRVWEHHVGESVGSSSRISSSLELVNQVKDGIATENPREIDLDLEK